MTTTAHSTAVELAPGHKLGLTLANPVLLMAGVIGYGDALVPGLDLAELGGFVTAPVTRRPRRGQPPRLLETAGGLLWQRGLWNPGVHRVVRDFGALWQHSPVPVIVHVAGGDPDEAAAVANACEQLPGVAGLEFDVPTGAGEAEAAAAAEWVWALRQAADLPLLARLSLVVSDATVQAVLDAGADALVLARPPRGLYLDADGGRPLLGEFYGPGLVPQVAARLADLAAWVQAPLVACGGIHDLTDVLTYLQAGAVAVQIGPAIWVDSELPRRVVSALAALTS